MKSTLRHLGAFLALSLSACSSGGEAPSATQPALASADAAQPSLAGFALAYQPTSDEDMIARAQSVVRASPQEASAFRGLAEAFLVRKRETADKRFFALAQDAISAARQLAPEDTKIRTTAVQLLFSDHRFQEAAEETRKLIAAEPLNATAHLLLSDALLEEGDYEGSVDALQDAMDISPDLRVFARGSYLRWLDGDLEGAIELMDDAIAMGTATPEALAWCYVELGMLHWHANALDEAERAAAKAAALISDYPAAIELQARIARSRGQSEAAIALYQKLVSRRSTVAAHVALSELLRDAGRSAEAARQRATAEAMAVHDPLALALHDARYSLSPEETLKRAQRAADERSNVYTRDALALALLRAGQIEAAKEASGELSMGSLDASLWLHRGLIMAAAGESQLAKDSLDRAIALNPSADTLLRTELETTLRTKASL